MSGPPVAYEAPPGSFTSRSLRLDLQPPPTVGPAARVTRAEPRYPVALPTLNDPERHAQTIDGVPERLGAIQYLPVANRLRTYKSP
jgi:hypothetical protein